MRPSSIIQSERDSLAAEIIPLKTRIEAIDRELRKAKSVEFIADNGITKADVELPGGHADLYFHTIDLFIDWLRKFSKKNWAEWNGRIYLVSDLLNNRMPDMPGDFDDLP